MSNDLENRQLGSYRVLELVERSGMVEVYRGAHVDMEREVTIKVIGRFLEPDPLLNERFRHDWKTIVQLRHPNILQVYDFGEEGGGHYIVREPFQGVPLSQLIDDMLSGKRYVDQDDITFLAHQVATGLDYAHGRGAIHYDLSTSTILLRPSGQAVVADFGLAVLKARTRGEAAGSRALGTPEYMSPEQGIDTGRITTHSDIYSLGVILYQMTTGTLPFSADTPVELALKHVHEEPPSPRQLNATLPRAVSQVILTAMAKDPAQRFDRAIGLANALAQAWDIDDADDVLVLPQGQLQREGEDEPIPVPASPEPGHEPEASITQTRVTERTAPLPAYKPPATGRRGISPVVIAGVAAVALIGLALFLGGRRLGIIGTGGRGSDEPLVVATPSPEAPTPSPEAGEPLVTETPAVTIVPEEAPIETPVSPDLPPLEAGSQALRLADAMVMVYVPEGPFLMGTDDASRPSREQPLHEVSLSGYWLDQTEVTNAQFRQCVEAGACPLPNVTRNYADPRYRNFPVAYLNWEAASAYCFQMGRATGLDVRLPTEAQWEKAASWDPATSTKRTYPWGEDPPSPELLRYDQSFTVFQGEVVGSYPAGASAYGAYDMAGNMFEYVFDWYQFDEDYYTLPEAAIDPQGPAQGTGRMVRGGSWTRSGAFATTTRRFPVELDTNGEDIGFRCATSASTITPDNNVAFTPQEALGSAQAAIAQAIAQGEGSPTTLNDWQAALITIDAQLEAGSDAEAFQAIDSRLQSLDALIGADNMPEETGTTLRNTLTWVRSQLPVEAAPEGTEPEPEVEAVG